MYNPDENMNHPDENMNNHGALSYLFLSLSPIPSTCVVLANVSMRGTYGLSPFFL